MKQRSAQSLQTTSLCYSNAKSTLLVPLTFIKTKKTKQENFSFVHHFLFSIVHNSKIIQCAQILCKPNDCSANGELGVS